MVLAGCAAFAILLLTIALLRGITTNTWPDGLLFGENPPQPTSDLCSDVGVVECAFRRYGKEDLYKSNQGRDFKTTLNGPNGFSITLERAYADTNQVLVSYSFHNSEGYTYFPNVVLKDDNGRELKNIGSMDSPVVTGRQALIQAYDASDLTASTSGSGSGSGNLPEVKFRLEIPSISGSVEEPAQTANSGSVQNSNSASSASNPLFTAQTRTNLVGNQIQTAYRATPAPLAPTPLASNLEFDFSLPFIQGRLSQPQLQVKGGGNGSPGTLLQVIVSPTQVRFKLKGTGSAPIVSFNIDGKSATVEGFTRYDTGLTSDGYQFVTYDTPLAWQKQGTTASLTLNSNPNWGMVQTIYNQTVVPGGPWVFTFKVP